MNSLTSFLYTLIAATLGWQGVGDDRQSLAELRQEFARFYYNEQTDRAIDVGIRLMDRTPKSAQDAFNLACAYCQNNANDQAIRWLETAAKSGLSRYSLLMTEGHVSCTRGDPKFEGVRQQVLQHHERALERLRTVATRRKPLIAEPPGLDRTKPAPLLIALHSLGGTPANITQVWRKAAAEFGAIIVAPRGDHRMIGSGFDWDDRREADIIVMGALAQVRKKHKIDDHRIVLTGFSQGGYLAFRLGVQHGDLFCGVIPMAGSYTLSPEDLTPISNKKTPRFFIMVGENDSPLESNRRAAADLKAQNIPHELHVYPKTAHTLPPNWEVESRKALRYAFTAQ